jgi:hypothetical protein
MPEEQKNKLPTTNETTSDGVISKSGKFVFANGDVYEGILKFLTYTISNELIGIFII